MVIGKIKPTATLVAQYPANCEVDAIEHDGRLFLPVVSLGAFTPTKEEDPKPVKKSAPRRLRGSLPQLPPLLLPPHRGPKFRRTTHRMNSRCTLNAI